MENKKKVAKIIVDRKTCIGAATCIVLAPDAFDLDEEGLAIVKPEGLKVDFNALLVAAQSCPTQSIKLLDEEGNVIST